LHGDDGARAEVVNRLGPFVLLRYGSFYLQHSQEKRYSPKLGLGEGIELVQVVQVRLQKAP